MRHKWDFYDATPPFRCDAETDFAPSRAARRQVSYAPKKSVK
jgi:hypothetical protein